MSQLSVGQFVNEVAKDAPIVAVPGIHIFGIPLPDVVLILTAIYTLMRIGGFIYDRFTGGKDEE